MTTDDLQQATHPSSRDAVDVANTDAAEGMSVIARTQGQLVRRRFLRHRAAMAGLVVLAGVIVLALSSIGFTVGPISVPGWWGQSWNQTGPVVNGGRPTISGISLTPPFINPSELAWGEHPFGQDNIGRDYFARVMRGTQVSLMITIVLGIVVTVTGTLVGALAGYFRGRTEGVLMRMTDAMIAIPTLVFAAVFASIVKGSGALTLAIILGLVTWTGLGRLVRSEFLSLREKEFVEAARAVGTRPWRIIWKHMLPNTLGVIIVSSTLTIAGGILLETALSFLGMGVQAPDVSLGSLVSEYQNAFQTRPWLFWWPGVFIVTIALAVNFVGDGLRDAFDPRQTRVRD